MVMMIVNFLKAFDSVKGSVMINYSHEAAVESVYQNILNFDIF